MFVIQATRAMINAQFAVMHDAVAIYLDADFNDPNRMMNMRSPNGNRANHQICASCQLLYFWWLAPFPRPMQYGP
jgi:hypothetical protein